MASQTRDTHIASLRSRDILLTLLGLGLLQA